MMTQPNVTIGLDLGDRMSDYCVVNPAGQVVVRGRVRTDRAAMTEWLRAQQGARVVLEVGTHSPWVSRVVTELGHTPFVANARRVKAGTAATRKSDRGCGDPSPGWDASISNCSPRC